MATDQGHLSIRFCQAQKNSVTKVNTNEHLKNLEKDVHSLRGYHSSRPIPVGTQLMQDQKPVLTIIGHTYLPNCAESPHANLYHLVRAESDLAERDDFVEIESAKKGISLAWITLSDSCTKGTSVDTSGPEIEELLRQNLPITHAQGFLLPDESLALRHLLTSLALFHQYDLICTTGGTGLTSRDITPETTERILDRPLPGICQAMMAKSLAITPNAALSRASAGIVGQSLIINLPGSRKGARENLEAVLQALPHALAKIHNDPTPCGQ